MANICQAVALKIPSTLMKYSRYKATLKADPDLHYTNTVRVNDGEIGAQLEISGADYTPAELIYKYSIQSKGQ